MPRRDPPTARRSPRRRTRPLILVVCASRRTEADYLRGLRDHSGNPAVDIVLTRHGRSPEQAVTCARKFVERDPRTFDEVWCVVDADQFDIPKATRSAARTDVELAVSNPCFELWLLLHHIDCTAYCADYDAVAERLQKHVPGYDKARLNFAHYRDQVPDATRRAKRLDPTGADHTRNPSTSMWRLTERITDGG